MHNDSIMSHFRDPDFRPPEPKCDSINITIDPQRCTNPSDCLLCMKACSPKLFAQVPAKKATKNLKERPSMIWCSDPELCTLCNRCIDVCPQKAIKIETSD